MCIITVIFNLHGFSFILFSEETQKLIHLLENLDNKYVNFSLHIIKNYRTLMLKCLFTRAIFAAIYGAIFSF